MPKFHHASYCDPLIDDLLNMFISLEHHSLLNEGDDGQDYAHQNCHCGDTECKHRTHKADKSEVVHEEHHSNCRETHAQCCTLNLLVIHEEEDKDKQCEDGYKTVHHGANPPFVVKSYYESHSE